MAPTYFHKGVYLHICAHLKHMYVGLSALFCRSMGVRGHGCSGITAPLAPLIGNAGPWPKTSVACRRGTHAANTTSTAPKRYIIQLLHDLGSGVCSITMCCLVFTLFGADVSLSPSTITSSYRAITCTSSRLRKRTLCGRSRRAGVGESSPFVSSASPAS